MFGDILSDEASQITGSIGLVPSASLGSGRACMSLSTVRPRYRGQGYSQSIATILSLAMMFEYSFGLKEADDKNAVNAVLEKG